MIPLFEVGNIHFLKTYKMIRYYWSGMVVVLSFLLTGCFEITEEITVNANGSGHSQLVMDMSKMLSNPFMEQAIAEEMKKEGPGMEEMEIDSTATFADMDTPDYLTARERTLLNRMSMHMDISKKKEKMIITVGYPFDDFAQMQEINTVLQRMKAEGEAAKLRGEEDKNPFGMLGGFSDMGGTESTFVFNKKTLERKAIKSEEVADDMVEEDGDMEEENMEEAMKEMMKQMFGDVTFRTIYTMPGKVKKTTFKNAVVKGKTVTVEYNMMDMMDEKADMDGMIKFK